MNRMLVATLAASALLCGTVHAQYGIMENYEGTGRFGNEINLTDGINFAYGGASGGGQGTSVAINGASGYGWGTGAAFSDGFGIQVRDVSVNDGPGVIDLTQVVNGMTSTGYRISLRDIDSDGVGGVDQFQLIVEDDSSPVGQEIFDIPAVALNSVGNFTFTAGTGTAGPNGIANRARFRQFIVRASSVAGSGANINVDDIGFTGNLVPTSLDVENFDNPSFDLGTLGTIVAGGRAVTRNTFGGALEGFSFGSDFTGASLVNDAGSGKALQVTLAGPSAGFFLDLGPATGSQTDVSAADGIQFDVAVDDAAQTLEVIVETINAPDFGDRCSVIITPTTTLAPVQIPFSSLSCGAQGFSANAVHRITILPQFGVDAGSAGIQYTVDNVKFYSATSGVEDWALID